MTRVIDWIFFIFAFAILLYPISVCQLDGDLMLYWGAFHAFISGGNPYSTQDVSSILGNIPLERTIWNPPLIFFYLIWVLIWPFDIAFVILEFLSVAAVFCIPVLVAKREKYNLRKSPATFLVCSLFVPTIFTLFLGQLSLIGTLIMYFSYCLIKEKKRDFLAGSLLPFLLIKAHIFGLYLSYVLVLSILEKRYRIIMGGIASFCISLLFVLIINPSSIPYSIAVLDGAKTFPSIGLSYFFYEFYDFRFHIYFFINLFYIALCVFLRKQLNFYILLCVAILLIPYGFYFDYAMLLPTLILVLFKVNLRDLVSISCFSVMIICNIVLYNNLHPIYHFNINPTASEFAVLMVLSLLIMAQRTVCKGKIFE